MAVSKAVTEVKNAVTGGATLTSRRLDRILEQRGIERLPGAHCYAFLAGDAVFDALARQEPGSFYLTDFLTRQFDAFVWEPLGLDRHPEGGGDHPAQHADADGLLGPGPGPASPGDRRTHPEVGVAVGRPRDRDVDDLAALGQPGGYVPRNHPHVRRAARNVRVAVEMHAALDARHNPGLLQELHPSDVADLVEALDTEEEQVALMEALPAYLASDTLAEMDEEEDPGDILAALDPKRGAELLRELDYDDAVDLVAELEPEERARILAALPLEEAGEIRGLLRYHEESAGGLMDTLLVRVESTLSAGQAIAEVRRQGREVDPARSGLEPQGPGWELAGSRPPQAGALPELQEQSPGAGAVAA